MRSATLVSTEQLARRLDDPDWIIFDCRFTLTQPEAGRQAYTAARIPGARYAHLDADLSAPVLPVSGRHPLPDPAILGEKLGRWGVSKDVQVVVYDDSFGSMAVRLWWLLRWLGHENVGLLDGGLHKWQREKRLLTADTPTIVSARFEARPNADLCADAAEVSAAIRRGEAVLDARPEERFIGFVEPLDKVAGHIPGAMNRPFEDNLDLDGTLLGADALRAAYLEALGATPPQRSIHMCGSGVSACHNLLAMEIAGLSGARLYPGSWSEWITDPSRPTIKEE